MRRSRNATLLLAVLLLLAAAFVFWRALRPRVESVDPSTAERAAQIHSELQDAAPDASTDNPAPEGPAAPAGRRPRAPR